MNRKLSHLLLLACFALMISYGTCPAIANPPPVNPDVQKLIDAGVVLRKQYKLQEALAEMKLGADKAKELKEVRGEALCFQWEGYIYSDLGEQLKALDYYKKAQSLYRAIGNKRGEATLLNNIGLVYSRLGENHKAQDYFKKALPLLRAVGNKRGEATSISSIGSVYSHRGEKQKALSYYEKALPLQHAVGDKDGEATTLHNIGKVYSDLGENQKALSYYEKALPLERATGDKSGEALTLSKIGGVYSHLGEKQKALSYYEKALPLQHAVGDKDGEATTLHNIGKVYSDIGENQKALSYYEKALPFERATGDKAGEATTLHTIGLVYSHLGENQKALSYYEKALQLERATGDKSGEALTLSKIGGVYSDLGDQRKALEYLEKALPLEHMDGDKHAEAITLNDIGLVYSELGKQRKALHYYEKALSLHRSAGEKGEEATTLHNIGAVYDDLGEKKKALDYYKKALPLERAVGDKDVEASTLYKIGYLQEQGMLWNEAEQSYKSSIALLETIRHDAGASSALKTSFLSSNIVVYHQLLILYSKRGRLKEAAALAEKTKSRALLDLAASDTDSVLNRATVAERKEWKSWHDRCAALNAEMIGLGARNRTGDKKLYAAKGVELQNAQRGLESYADSLIAHHFNGQIPNSANTLNLKEIQNSLPEDTALLEYIYPVDSPGNPHPLVLVVKKDGVSSYPLDYETDALARLTTELSSACAYPYIDANRKNKEGDPWTIDNVKWKSNAMALYRVLLAPAMKVLQGKWHLLICPDGPIWNVSFETLLAAADNDRFEISYAYSATSALAPHKAVVGEKAMGRLVMANPKIANSRRFGDFIPGQRPFKGPDRPFAGPDRPFSAPDRFLGDMALYFTTASPLGSLAGAAEEGQYLKSLPDTSALFGEEANETAFKRDAGRYRYLHFATHAFFNEYAPMFSSIVLADPADPKAEDGFLTALEISELKLNAEMVVLSACSTAKGSSSSGEGLIGMTWAFAVAGVPSQVVSQWSVDDAATAKLMQMFYANLNRGVPKAEALHNAARELSKNPKYAHPYYWAPFILMGDWR